MAALRERDSISARALEFAVLTAGRTGSILGAKWSEINLAEKIWTISADRMKGRVEHRVPLAPAAIALLTQMQAIRVNDYVFPGQRGPLSHKTLQLVLRGPR